MHDNSKAAISKVPEITLAFWVIKILATTLGETGGDAVSMSMELGYLVSTGIFAVIFFVSVSAQIAATSYNPLLYWTTIIATTTVGTTLADFVDRSLGLGYAGGSTLLLALLMGSFLLWYRLQGSISTGSITTPRTELFYWVTIMFSQTLGTALGDWTADEAGFGYAGSTLLFWAAFILTRPLGAVVGDFLDKPLSKGWLELSRYSAFFALLAAIATLVLISTLRNRQPVRAELDIEQ
ncbi:COG4705 family protein [Aeromonas dhakensis]|uniref:COG4705 family protein n=1 Tax=Aeromonas dhakensis TaxID=196024 RepID=UPI0038D150EC